MADAFAADPIPAPDGTLVPVPQRDTGRECEGCQQLAAQVEQMASQLAAERAAHQRILRPVFDSGVRDGEEGLERRLGFPARPPRRRRLGLIAALVLTLGVASLARLAGGPGLQPLHAPRLPGVSAPRFPSRPVHLRP